jgi:hypothetical protein
MLINATRPSESTGDVGFYLSTHNRGQRWHGSQSSGEYRTILDRIRGGRMQATSAPK